MANDTTGEVSSVDLELIENNVSVSANSYDAAANSHAIAVLTEWDEFKSLDFAKILTSMPQPAFVFDGRNILDHAKLRSLGFEVHAIGKR